MLCDNCENRKPAVIVYSKAVPISNENCESCGSPLSNFFPPPAPTGKTTEIISSDGSIVVNDISDPNVDRFDLQVFQYLDLDVNLSVDPKSGGVSQPGLVLFGTVLDEFVLNWAYNKAILTQTLSNDGGLTDPTLLPTDTDYTYAGANITDDILFTIQGNDGAGQPGSIANDSVTVQYGNYRVWGKGARSDLGSTAASTLISFIEGLIAGAGTKEVSRTRVKSNLIGEGGVLEYFYYAFPKRFGFATFTQNSIPGGFKRLANVGGTIQVGSLTALEPGEIDISISNGVASEAYYIYQTASDNVAGAVFDVS